MILKALDYILMYDKCDITHPYLSEINFASRQPLALFLRMICVAAHR